MTIRLYAGAIALAVGLVVTTPAQAQAPLHHQAKKSAPRAVKRVNLPPKRYAKKLIASKGWSARQFGCLLKLWEMESSWNPKAKNPHSTAFGIWQGITETSKDPIEQVRNGVRYIERRYGSACNALTFHYANGWY